MLPSVIIKDILVSEGFTFGGVGNWAVYIGKRPPTPNRSITIYDTPGLNPSPKWLLDYPSISIHVRGNTDDYQVAGEKMREVRDHILGKPSYTISPSNDRMVSITALGDLSFLTWDETDRPVWYGNYQMIIEPATNVNTHREAM